jgi:hypothetical protein
LCSRGKSATVLPKIVFQSILSPAWRNVCFGIVQWHPPRAIFLRDTGSFGSRRRFSTPTSSARLATLGGATGGQPAGQWCAMPLAAQRSLGASRAVMTPVFTTCAPASAIRSQTGSYRPQVFIYLSQLTRRSGRLTLSMASLGAIISGFQRRGDGRTGDCFARRPWLERVRSPRVLVRGFQTGSVAP